MRKFLVVMDDSSEFLNALYFAARRAQKTGGGVVILSVVDNSEFQHWLGVQETMEQEARENIEAHFKVFEKWMMGKVEIEPELLIRKGRKSDEILSAIEADKEIGVLVLGAGKDRKGPGPLIQELVAKRGGEMPIPVTIVPVNMSREELEKVT